MAPGVGTTALGVSKAGLVSIDVGEGDEAKKLVMKVYSEVELSMNTRKSERRRPSIGSFYLSHSK